MQGREGTPAGNKQMKQITITDEVTGRGPRRFGVNVEVQDHADRSNLWDFLADSGLTCARTFHPEQSMRRSPATPGELGDFHSWQDFLSFREQILKDPEDGPIQWDAYLFDEQIPWMGVPSEFLRRYQELRIEAMVSIGIGPGSFPISLVPDLMAETPPTLNECHPEAAAVLYEYAFAVIYTCAKNAGVRTFMTVNEPEWAPGFFHVAEDLRHLKRLPIIRESDHGRFTPEGDLYRRCLGIQFASMAELIRMALDDVQSLLGLNEPLLLSGPTSNQFFSTLSQWGAPWLDVLDFHHYSDEAESHQKRVDQAHHVAQATPGKKIAISEFNLKAGPTPYEKMLFVLPAALRQASILLTALQAGSPDNPLDFLALYLFAGPSTHRSFKHLVYGDLNLLSWDGNDSALRSKGPEWYPSFEELQLRFCTPAYHMVKALARAVTGAGDQGCEILQTSHSLPESCTVFASRVASETFLTILDRQMDDAFANKADHQVDAPENAKTPTTGPTYSVHLPKASTGKWVIIRRTSTGVQDGLLDVRRIPDNELQVEACPQSLTQLIVTEIDLASVSSLKLEEQGFTPGSCEKLALHQTLRLRAIGDISGEEIDLSDRCIHWESSAPHTVSVGPTGLVQRLRNSPNEVVITATALPSGIQARQLIPGSSV